MAWGRETENSRAAAARLVGLGKARRVEGKAAASGRLNVSCRSRSRRSPGLSTPSAQMGRPVSPPGHHHVLGALPACPESAQAFTGGSGLEETLLPLSPAAPGHFLALAPSSPEHQAWVSTLSQGQGVPQPPRRFSQPRPRPGSRSRPSS